MEQKNYQKWTWILIICVVCTLAGFAFIEYTLDPLIHYGKESGILTSYEYTEMYSNPGIAKHYDYDAVMVGTSMVEHTDIDVCDSLWNCKMVRLPYSGGTTFNMKTILDVCFNNNKQIKTVYWELDEFQLLGSSTEPRYPLPTYLYRDDHKEDVKYLLNLDIFYHYTVLDLFGTSKGENQPVQHRQVPSGAVYSKEAVLKGYSRLAEQKRAIDSVTYLKKVDENLDRNIVPLIEAYFDTKFVFFMPPFSVLYWDRTLRDGTFDANMDAVEYAVERLLEYDNVEIYFYQNEKSIITNLDNYKDFSHYKPGINDLVTQMIADRKGQLNKENYMIIIESMRSYIHRYPYEELFVNQ